ncbi:MAG: hypothetical protein RL368_550 [Pseudomonadota bacterium]
MKYYSSREASKILNVHANTLKIKNGRIVEKLNQSKQQTDN